MKTIILLLLFCYPCFAQTDSLQNLYFAKKRNPQLFNIKDYQPGNKSFYIYRNCVYHFVLKDKQELLAHVMDIKNDSIYYKHFHVQSDSILSLSPSQLKKIRLIADRSIGIMSGRPLKKRRYVFVNSPYPKVFERVTDTVRHEIYELVPYMTHQGIDRLYQKCNKAYYYEGMPPIPCEDSAKTNKPPVVKKWAWFTPSKANVIKGLNVGIETMHVDDEPLTIEGVNLNAGMLTFFVSWFSLFQLPLGNNLITMEDHVDTSVVSVWVKGMSVSGGGLAGDMQVKGVSFNGGICSVTETKGLVITGTQNLSYIFRGVTITGLRNRAIKGRGMQIGLLNICKDLKGIQVGLWNVNSKRRMPLINWSF